MMKHITKYAIMIFALCIGALPTRAQIDVRNYESFAKHGDKEAMYRLAENLYYGRNGVNRDVNNAMIWFERSASKGYAPAQKFLGNCYLHGDVVNCDYKKAFKYLSKAADGGDGDAMYSLAQMYLDGLYVKKNYGKYLYYIDAAATKGNNKALHALGQLYLDGEPQINIEPDNEMAVHYFMEAANRGNADAQYFIGSYYAQLGEMKPAFDYFLMASRNGNAAAYYNTGLCCYLGEGTRRDYTEALQWLKKAAANKEVDAYSLVGNIYYYGLEVTSNLRTALDYYIKGAQIGDEEAVTQLARIYLDDSALITDPNMIYDIFNDRSVQGNADGYAGLGVCYEKGIGTDKSDIKAVSYYVRAADAGNGFANYRLYKIFAEGQLGESPNKDRAMTYLRKAVADEYADAVYALGLELVEGKNTQADTRLGLDYIRRAAEMSNTKACAWLGNLYYSGGHGVARDYTQAFKYLEQFLLSPDAVDLEIRRKAFRNIGACYRFGRGTVPDESLADIYTRKAYDTYDIDALLNEQ